MNHASFQPAEYDELNDVLYTFTQELQTVLADRFVAAYLQGSFALGGGHSFSDVDFLVVVEDDPDETLKDVLQAMHRRIYEMEPHWAQHLEGSYFPREELRELSSDPLELWYLDNGSRTLERSTHDNDYVVRWVTREHGITLAGPPSHTLIDPINPADLRAEVKGVMHNRGNEILSGEYPLNSLWAHTFAVIAYCRMMQTLATDAIHSKQAAVEWALTHLETRWHALIKRSWAARDKQYEMHPPVAADAEQTKEFIRAHID
jgi:hypothetical protein